MKLADTRKGRLPPLPQGTRMLSIICLVAFAGALPGETLEGQVVELFPVAVAPPAFGKWPRIAGQVVVWKRSTNRIQGTDISHLDNRVVDLAPYPVGNSGIELSPHYLFRGAGAGFPDGNPVTARPIDLLDATASEPDILITNYGLPIAVNAEFLFIKVASYEAGPEPGSIVAVPVHALSGLSVPEPRLVTKLGAEPLGGRLQAASDRYLVWQDRDVERDTWKIHAKRTDDLFSQEAELVVIDSKRSGAWAVCVDVHDSLLIFEGPKERSSGSSPNAMYLFDLETREGPVVLAETDDLILTYPAISEFYAVWVETSYFDSTAYAVPLANGRPAGEPFVIASGPGAGDFMTIDRNIVVWNGSTRVQGQLRAAIMAAELDLPGARDVGDVNHDGSINISDPLFTVNYLFRGGPRPRLRLADADVDREITPSDVVVILEYLFRGGRRPGGS